MGTHQNKLGIFVLVVDFNLDKLWQSLFPNCLQLNWRGQSELLASSQIHSKWFLALLWFEQGCYSQIWVTLFLENWKLVFCFCTISEITLLQYFEVGFEYYKKSNHIIGIIIMNENHLGAHFLHWDQYSKSWITWHISKTETY